MGLKDERGKGTRKRLKSYRADIENKAAEIIAELALKMVEHVTTVVTAGFGLQRLLSVVDAPRIRRRVYIGRIEQKIGHQRIVERPADNADGKRNNKKMAEYTLHTLFSLRNLLREEKPRRNSGATQEPRNHRDFHH